MTRGVAARATAVVMAAAATVPAAPGFARDLLEGRSAVAKILPPEPGRMACYRRMYDERHMAGHPRQTVAEMTFLLRVAGVNANGDPAMSSPVRVNYLFALELRRRGDTRSMATSGDCAGDRAAECVVACDGGGVEIEPRGPGLIVRLRGEGIALGGDCATTRGRFVAPGADDRVFELQPAPMAACRPVAWRLAQ